MPNTYDGPVNMGWQPYSSKHSIIDGGGWREDYPIRDGLVPPDIRRRDCFMGRGVKERDDVMASAIHFAWEQKRGVLK